MLKFEEIISKFQIEGEITDVKPLGHGTVNHTYEIVCGGEHYVTSGDEPYRVQISYRGDE